MRPGSRPGRDRYLDLWRAAAILRVVAFHATGWAWLNLAFPAMGLMFGIAGSLMAASADRYGHRAVVRRMRRFLVPLWVYAAVTVAVLVAAGWSIPDLGPAALVWWVVPARVPPTGGPAWAWAFNVGLWYLVTYFWLVLLSPLLLRLFRRWPWPCLAVATVLPLPYLFAPAASGYFVATYLSCWLLGFAHHDGLLRRLPARACVAAIAGLAVAGGGGLLVAARAGSGFDPTATPGAWTLWSMAFVAAVLRFRPRAGQHGRRARGGFADRAAGLVNARAVTIYLWHIPGGVLIAGLLVPVLTGDPLVGEVLRALGPAAAIAVAVPLLGWVEDLAGGRRRAPAPAPAGSAPAGPAATPCAASTGRSSRRAAVRR
ncbi:acyltransferase family protein [Dactylosporangium sp. CA-092794]|uniref:acyltransferase family protein n=1 Tax=Dactylosporangium sp. CA-092794 TaxID=3239929 RepID=UPI003D931A79